MDLVLTAITLSGVLLALVLSVLSLTLHWRHRDESPAIAKLSTRIGAVSLEILDLGDKVAHWRQRDSVRKARAGAEAKDQAIEEGTVTGDSKSALRKRARAANIGFGG